jgi:tetratricopeptide (TPR) repeat protein
MCGKCKITAWFSNRILIITSVYFYFKRKQTCQLESSIPFRKNENMIENIPCETIETALNKQKNKCLVLYGPPRIGKTTNALNFAWYMNDEKNSWICLWFNAESVDKFMVDLVDLTDLLSEAKSDNKSFGYRLQLVKKEFRSNPKINFLIVLDNLNEYEWIESLFTNLSRNVSIIATSTKRSVLDTIGNDLKVNYFSEEQARTFYRNKFEKKRELARDEIELLETYFKYDQILPYDLNFLISELNNNEFINLKELFDGYKSLCEKIFVDLYERIDKKSHKAWKTLKYCSYVDPVAIPAFLVLEWLQIDKFELEMIVRILKNNSVIDVVVRLGEKCLNMHRRTQTMIKRIVSVHEKTTSIESNVFEVVLNEFDPCQEYDRKKWNNSKLLIQNILIGLQSTYSTNNEQLIITCDKLGYYYSFIIVDYKRSLDYFSRLLEINKNGESKHEIASSLNKVGSAHFYLSNFRESLEFHLKSLKIIKDIHHKTEENKQLEIADSYNNIAEVYNKLSFYQKGLTYHLNSLKINRAICGENKFSPSIATSLSNVGSTYLHLGKIQKSLNYHLNSLKMRKSIYGENQCHPEIANSLALAAEAYNKLGLLCKSLEFSLKSLAMRKAVYGENDSRPEIANSLGQIGQANFLLGKFKESLEYHSNSLSMNRAIYGENETRPEIAESLGNVGLVYMQMGNFQESLEYQLNSLNMYKALYGKNENSLKIAESLNNVGATYYHLGRFTECLEFHLQSLSILKSIYGENQNHPEIASSLNNIALVYHELGLFQKGLELNLESLHMSEAIYGENANHPSIAKSFNNVAESYSELGNFEKGLEYHLKSLNMRKAIYGECENDPEIANSINNIGATYSQLGQHDESLEYHLKCLNMNKAIYGENENIPAIATSLSNVEQAYNELGFFDKGLEFNLAGLQMTKAIFGENENHF